MMKRINFEETKLARRIKTELEIEPVLKSLVSNEEVIETIPEEYPLVKVEPEIQDEFHAVMDVIKCEDTKIAGQFETVYIKTAMLSENHEVPRPEQSLECSKASSKLNKDKSSLCRLCATRANGMVHMFDPNQLYKNIIEKIEQCLPIVVRESDTLPKEACRMCLDKLELCYQFHNSVAEAEKQLLASGKQTSGKLRATEECCKSFSLYNEQYYTAKRHANNDGKSKTTDENKQGNKSISISEEPQIIDMIVENKIISSNSKAHARGLLPTKAYRLNDSNENRSGRSSSDKQDCTFETSVDDLNSPRMSAPEIVRDTCYSPLNSSMRPSPVEELKGDQKMSDLELCRSLITRNHQAHNSLRKESRNYGNDDDVIFCKKELKDQIFSDPSIKNKLITCRVCEKAFQNAEGFHSHAMVHASAHYYPCCICDEIFITERDRRKHGLDHMKGNKLAITAVTKDCDKSENNFVAQLKQKFHKLCHNSNAKPKCISEEQSRTQEAPDEHQKKPGLAVICIWCKNRFHADLLEVHEETCSKRQPIKKNIFTCAYCGKEFDRKGFIEAHIRTHTGEQPYKCKLCAQRFKSKRTRNNHLKIHKGKRLFECSICDKTFPRLNALKGHTRVHSERISRECPVCYETFDTPELRNSHIVIHSRMISCQCDSCGMYFTAKRNLVRHIRTQHGQLYNEN